MFPFRMLKGDAPRVWKRWADTAPSDLGELRVLNISANKALGVPSRAVKNGHAQNEDTLENTRSRTDRCDGAENRT